MLVLPKSVGYVTPVANVAGTEFILGRIQASLSTTKVKWEDELTKGSCYSERVRTVKGGTRSCLRWLPIELYSGAVTVTGDRAARELSRWILSLDTMT